MSNELPKYKTRIVVELLADSEQDLSILEHNYRAVTLILAAAGTPASFRTERFIRDEAAEQKTDNKPAGKEGASPLN